MLYRNQIRVLRKVDGIWYFQAVWTLLAASIGASFCSEAPEVNIQDNQTESIESIESNADIDTDSVETCNSVDTDTAALTADSGLLFSNTELPNSLVERFSFYNKPELWHWYGQSMVNSEVNNNLEGQ